MAWSKEEKLFVINNYTTLSDTELTEKINRFSIKKRSKEAVRKFRQRLGLDKERGWCGHLKQEDGGFLED